MFESRASRRSHSSRSSRRSRRGSTKPRRLGVETMEGRLMLSATTGEYAPLQLHGTPVTLAVGQLDSGEQPIRLKLMNEGGFITNLSVSDVAMPTGILNDSTSVAVLLSFRDAATNELFSLSGTSELFVNGAYALDSDGLQVVVFFNNNGLVARNFAGVVIPPPEKSLAREEGGSIPIQELLVGLRKEVEVASNEQAVSSLAVEKPIDAHSSKHFAASSTETTISGEWGRAVVFEFAGGEPAVGERARLGDHGAKPARESTEQGNVPLSTIEARGDGDSYSDGEQQAAQPNNQAADDRTGERHDNQVDVFGNGPANQIGNATGILIEGKLPRMTPQSQSARIEQGIDGAPGNGDAVLPALATAAAFEQLGEEKIAFVESSGEKWWERSLGLSPLLMVLAMERIAAHHSRQPKREAPTVTAQKASRPQDLAGSRRKQ
jgi:hypothetical protein